MSWIETFPFACPVCRGLVQVLRGDAPGEAVVAFRCDACVRTYPVLLGIPDFRVAPDPWIGIEEDRAKGERLARDTAAAADLESVVRAYWRMTPDTPAAQAERFIAHVLGAPRRSRAWLEAVNVPARAPEAWLDLGCGTADIAEVVDADTMVIGVDVAFRWLVVARRRLLLLGREPRLVCANAEALPFPDAQFDRIVSLGTVEHLADAPGALVECHRVMRPGASLLVRTVNRYSLLPEPHVGLLGVGWMPRAMAEWWVTARTGGSYRHHHPLGSGALRRALRAASFARVEVRAAALLRTDRERVQHAPLRMLMPLYTMARRMPVLSWLVRAVAPLLDAVAYRHSVSEPRAATSAVG